MSATGRIEEHPILGPLPERSVVTFRFNGVPMQAYQGETIAAALLAAGIRTLRLHEEKGTPRGIYCNIGHCFECRVTVNGRTGIRACLTLVEEGMEITAGEILPTPLKKGGHPA
ncbi:(2Fe-2S)-binding protein [Brevibacillus sp. SYP-B805]|uniref:(2Fe-2S)-binding protein n=1 Tax=Brevibacillus sp. SYP-B805 TaxID=1578199 RepID=UPI0013EB5485|nr:(2Fe-2S)-binding protein [Brevibacillus sp. SYP-B805]NGQ97447.1 (2Fe-2S)-binding protein [Brevibacillus sp. SYP-B805]